MEWMRYLAFSLIFLFIWVVIFLKHKKLRREMLFASILLTPLVFTEPFFVPHYWVPDSLLSPELSIEDFIIGFSISGIAAVLYESTLALHSKHVHLRHTFVRDAKEIFALLAGLVLVFVSYFLFRIDFIYSVYIGMIVAITSMIVIRKDLARKMLYSSLLFGFFYWFVFSIFSTFLVTDFLTLWKLHNLSGFILLGVPIEEVIWGFAAGALAGPIYEYVLSLRFLITK